jgi:hypothetical protein
MGPSSSMLANRLGWYAERYAEALSRWRNAGGGGETQEAMLAVRRARAQMLRVATLYGRARDRRPPDA